MFFQKTWFFYSQMLWFSLKHKTTADYFTEYPLPKAAFRHNHHPLNSMFKFLMLFGFVVITDGVFRYATH
jgi:hypothetical protein